MADNLLAIVQKACGRLGIAKPTVVFGSTVLVAQQLLDLALEEGGDLLVAHTWSGLTVEGATLSLVAGQEAYPLPADCDRLVTGTQWDRTNRWPTFGPDDAQTARARRESVFGNASMRRALRQVGNTLTVWPVPTTTGDVLAYDYVSNLWVASASGAPQSVFQADTDVPRIPSELFVYGLKWRFMFSKGMDADALKADYDRRVALAISADRGGNRTINLGRRQDDIGNCDDVIAGAPTVVLGTSNGAGLGVD